ncbi:glycosyltransferase family 9 protein [Chitinispirillales bacterium ANBcel5]|uniref:glycosyltransferase family 9 protein n=1 Tax=Cellulosispirillum alkaliphilum TaxID=3039283 RepID=UPI002A54C82D|nr:glycosyltransferase family 9 protein [Chitinispirillales bacterium ANBcel5]
MNSLVKHTTDTEKRVLIIRLSSMGDVILVSTVLSYIKLKHPMWSITLITSAPYLSLFRKDHRVKELYAADDDDALNGIKPHFYKVIDLQNSSKSKRLIKRLGITGGVQKFKKLHLQRFLLLFTRINTYDLTNGVAARYLQAAGAHRNTPPPSLKLYFDSEPKPECSKLFQKEGEIIRPMIALFPFSAWRNKEWPAENFIKLGTYFSLKGWKVLIMGGVEDVAAARQISLEIGNNCVSLAGKLTLFECGTVLKNCTLALGGDTGLSHLARACGVKTGVIFGPTTRHFGFYPYGLPMFRVFETGLRCRPCHPHGGNVCIRGKRNCMISLSPEMVTKTMEGMVQQGDNNSSEITALDTSFCTHHF